MCQQNQYQNNVDRKNVSRSSVWLWVVNYGSPYSCKSVITATSFLSTHFYLLSQLRCVQRTLLLWQILGNSTAECSRWNCGHKFNYFIIHTIYIENNVPKLAKKGETHVHHLSQNFKYSYILMMCTEKQKQLKHTIKVIHSHTVSHCASYKYLYKINK